MLREDFVSNSSSCSFVFSFTKKDFKRCQEHPHTILDAVVKKMAGWNCSDLPEPEDHRTDIHKRGYDWKGNRREFNIKKYEWLICPCDHYIDRDSAVEYKIATVKKYLKCCDECDSKVEDGYNCYRYEELKKVLSELKKNHVVIKFRIDDCDYITSHDLDHDTEKDKRRIIFHDEH